MAGLNQDNSPDTTRSKVRGILSMILASSSDLAGCNFRIPNIVSSQTITESIEFLRSAAAVLLTRPERNFYLNDVSQKHPKASQAEATFLLRNFAYALTSEAVSRVVDDSSKMLRSALESNSAATINEAITIADVAARMLCKNFFFYDEYGETRITYQNLFKHSYLLPDSRLELDTRKDFAETSSGAPLATLSALIKQAKFHLKLITSFPRFDASIVTAGILKYGAKGARLLALEKAEAELAPFVRELDALFKVPNFHLVPVAVYDEHRQNLSSCKLIRDAYEWTSGREVLIRSSAVFSEDGEHLGAGIYKTLRLPSSASLDLFCQAIEQVYQSIDSPLAQKYRQSIGFSGAEKMGIIVQDFVECSGQDESPGHINTVRPQMLDICEVVFQQRRIPFYTGGKSDEVENGAAVVIPMFRELVKERFTAWAGPDTSTDRNQMLVLPSDITRIINDRAAIDAAKIGLLLELYFGAPLQIEFVQKVDSLNLVQARPLPQNWLKAAQVSFPEREDYLWRGSSFGIIDKELEILGDDQNNSNREGLVILGDGGFGSFHLSWLNDVLPAQGAVWLLRPSAVMRGHVESRCAERGVTVITGELPAPIERQRTELINRFCAAYGEDIRQSAFLRTHKPNLIPPSKKLSHLRIVSNGLEARIYTPDSLRPTRNSILARLTMPFRRGTNRNNRSES